MDKVLIFDTTLRDGEQSPGATLNIEEKIDIARQLARLGVDVIEAGFPISSPGDFEAVRRIAHEVEGPIIAGLARAMAADVDRAAEALQGASRPRIHVFISSSDIHLEHQVRKSREEALDMAVEMVRRAKSYVEDVEFSPMDAARSDVEYLCQMVEAVIEAGATTVNIPDTVGYRTPGEFGDMIKKIMECVPNAGKAIISVHCHNDLGLATANSLSAVLNGARQVECTINGIGERAGNASLEEIVMAIRTRGELFNAFTNIDTTQIYNTSRMVSRYTGIPVQPNKAIVGQNAFAHESGIHQDGMLKSKDTFEIMNAKDVGWNSSSLVLGKHSGRHALKSRLAELGYDLGQDDLNRAFNLFKEMADRKKEITDADLEAIVTDEVRSPEQIYRLDLVQVATGDPGIPMASVKMTGPGGETLVNSAIADGPVEAVYRAIDKVVQVPTNLVDFSIRAASPGVDALGEASVKIERDGVTYSGRAASTDIVIACAKAYMNALNRYLAARSQAAAAGPSLHIERART